MVFSGAKGAPPVRIHRRPAYDAVEGIDLLHALLKDKALDLLTLPHLFCCRSLLEAVSFRNADLSQSVLVWSDFQEVDFAGADLRDSDLRSSSFVGCCFDGCNLDDCDLRCSAFEGCSFQGASLRRAMLTAEQLGVLPVSEAQRALVRIGTPEAALGG